MKPFPILKLISGVAMLALILPACRLAAQNPDSAAISKLLEQVKSHAALADNDASTLESYTRSTLHPRTHAVQLNQIRMHINNLIEDGNEMSSLRPSGSPWQQEAIDRISPLLSEMATHLTATINHFNENKSSTQMQPYRNLVVANQTLIHKAHEIIADFVDYAEAKDKASGLERQLELPATASAEP
jgi:hypothetical protein